MDSSYDLDPASARRASERFADIAALGHVPPVQGVGIEAERQATRALGLAIHAALPEGWDSIEYTVAIAGGVSNAQVDIRREGVDEIGTVRPTHEMRSHARELHGAMYREGTGTWFSAGSYAEDLARFPRDPEHVPAWLRELLRTHRPDDRRRP